MHMGFGGLHGRGAKKQDPPIERELALSLEEVYHGCIKKMQIARRVCKEPQKIALSLHIFECVLFLSTVIKVFIYDRYTLKEKRT